MSLVVTRFLLWFPISLTTFLYSMSHIPADQRSPRQLLSHFYFKILVFLNFLLFLFLDIVIPWRSNIYYHTFLLPFLNYNNMVVFLRWFGHTEYSRPKTPFIPHFHLHFGWHSLIRIFFFYKASDVQSGQCCHTVFFLPISYIRNQCAYPFHLFTTHST